MLFRNQCYIPGQGRGQRSEGRRQRAGRAKRQGWESRKGSGLWGFSKLCDTAGTHPQVSLHRMRQHHQLRASTNRTDITSAVASPVTHLVRDKLGCRDVRMLETRRVARRATAKAATKATWLITGPVLYCDERRRTLSTFDNNRSYSMLGFHSTC